MISPLISIIVPVYNVEAYLRECLDSVLAQSYTNWECICVNDGSPDNSQAILDEYAQRDTRFRVIAKENGGVSSARNEGLNQMKGQYFTFLDADDCYAPHALDLYMSLALKHSADIVEASAYLFSSDGQVHWADWEEEWNTLEDAHYKSGEVPPLLKIKPYVWNALYHRHLWHDASVYFHPCIRIAEDFLFKTRLIQSLSSSYVLSSNRIYGYRKGRLDSAMNATRAASIADDELLVYQAIARDWQYLGRWSELQGGTMELLYHSARNRLPHMSRAQAFLRSMRMSIFLFSCFISHPAFTQLKSYLKHQKAILRLLYRRLKLSTLTTK